MLRTFKIPTVDGIREAHGYKVRLMVGDKREWFALQLDGLEPAQLTHWGTGYKIANLRAIALRHFVQTGYFDKRSSGKGNVPYWRKFAQRKLDEIEPARFWAQVAGKEVLNHV